MTALSPASPKRFAEMAWTAVQSYASPATASLGSVEARDDAWLVLAPPHAFVHPEAAGLIAVAAAARPDVAVFYGDVAVLRPAARPELLFRPALDRTQMMAQDYVGPTLAVRGSAFHALGGLRPEAGGARLYDLVLRALPLIIRLRRDEFAEAGDLLNRALALEPDYATAHAWRAYWGMFCVGQGWADKADELLAESGRHAERAITLDPQDARALTIAGHVRAFLHRRPREALELHARALSLNPNLAMAWGLSATTYTYLGELDEAARRFARYKRLSPMDPNAFFFEACTVILELCRRDYPAAVIAGRRASELNPHFTAGLKHYLAALGHAKLVDEALVVRDRLLAMEPGYTVQVAVARNPYESMAEMDHYADGLRLAGLAEGSKPASGKAPAA